MNCHTSNRIKFQIKYDELMTKLIQFHWLRMGGFFRGILKIVLDTIFTTQSEINFIRLKAYSFSVFYFINE